MANLTDCAICGVKASQLCGGCKDIVYCGREHQKEHWKRGHKQQCKCYEIAQNAVLGRHIRAMRDIKIGEIILREAPFIMGPKIASVPLCLGCHRNLLPPESPQGNYYKCSKCTWPLCSVECETSPYHMPECQLMANNKFQSKLNYNAAKSEAGKKESDYCVIMLLRCMQLKRTDPQGFARLYELENHLQERNDTPLYQVLRTNVLTFVKTVLGLKEWPEIDVLRIAAILDTNTFEMRQPEERRKIRVLYLSAAMISHDCVPNTRHTFDAHMNIVFLAKRKIAKGEIIAISYTQPLRSTLQRRLHLRQAKCFDCTCARCSDATELGTFAGAVLCQKCKVGKIISTKPLENTASWRCQLCNTQKPLRELLLQDSALQQELEALDKSTPLALEDFIHRYRDVLHETNTHVLQAKYALSQLYGNTEGFTTPELGDAALERKVELCNELLQIAEIVDGGSSIFRGNLLFDLEEALAEQAARDTHTEECKAKLEQASQLLQEVCDIMRLQPEMTTTLEERKRGLSTQLERLKPQYP